MAVRNVWRCFGLPTGEGEGVNQQAGAKDAAKHHTEDRTEFTVKNSPPKCDSEVEKPWIRPNAEFIRSLKNNQS